MEFRQLRHFVAVVEAGNFSRAAETLRISQPALTRSIQNLERDLGSQLLLRQQSGIVPTEAGKLFVKRANLLLNDWAHTKTDLAALKGRTEGHLSICVAPLFSRGMLGLVLGKLIADHPTVTVQITESAYDGILRTLSDGRCDVAFSTFPRTEREEGFRFDYLLDVRPHIIAGKSHPLADKRSITDDDLISSRWALMEQRGATVGQYLNQQGVRLPDSAITTNSVNLLIDLVKQGGFLTALPSVLLIEELNSGAMKSLDTRSPAPPRQAGVIYPENRAVRPLVKTLAGYLAQFAALYGANKDLIHKASGSRESQAGA